MITLRRMTEDEFLRFKEYSIADYAKDLADGQQLSMEQALETSEREFTETLPKGLETDGQFLMMILDAESGKDSGYIWFFYEEENGIQVVWLCDFLIYEDQRGKGYAKAALAEMERMAKAAGCVKSVLFVWDHNPAGKSLYQKCGYVTTRHEGGGAIMKKCL